MFLQLRPALAERCHCAFGAGVPEAVAVKLAIWPVATDSLRGCVVTVGAFGVRLRCWRVGRACARERRARIAGAPCARPAGAPCASAGTVGNDAWRAALGALGGAPALAAICASPATSSAKPASAPTAILRIARRARTASRLRRTAERHADGINGRLSGTPRPRRRAGRAQASGPPLSQRPIVVRSTGVRRAQSTGVRRAQRAGRVPAGSRTMVLPTSTGTSPSARW